MYEDEDEEDINCDRARSFTLDWVNDIRLAHNANPLRTLRPGTMGDHKSCPIALSLADLIPPSQRYPSVGGMISLSENEHHYPPSPVQAFIDCFDDGEYEDLVLDIRQR